MDFKKLYTENKMYFKLGFTLFFSSLFAYLGFKKGVNKVSKEANKAKIDSLKSQEEKIIIKEKLADKEKPISEISSDIDSFLDRK